MVGGYSGVVLDVDGVLCRGTEPIPGAGAAVAELRRRGLGVALATNNASRTPAQVAAALAGIGIPVGPQDVITSAIAAAGMVEPGTRCLVIGMEGLRGPLAARGCVEVTEPDDAEVVVVGIDTGLVYDDLRRATLALHRGARFVATNTDAALPVPDGIWPGNGAIVAALRAATGREPEVAGKPYAPLFQAAAAALPAGPLLMVGDRPETDLDGARAMGWDTALVLSGITSAEAAAALDPQPTYVLPDLAALVAG
jgi:glycerol-1-phosphatase